MVGFGISPEIYVPVAHDGDYVQLYARMPQGMTLPIARARLQAVLEQLDRIHPNGDWKRRPGTRVTSLTGFDLLKQEMPNVVTAFFAMLLIVVGLVLLIACTNVASLLLARASSRSRELAIRLSLGASRRRIVRHLLAESFLLCVLGSIAGLAINIACAKLINNLTLPVPVPIHLVVAPDGRLLWYSLGVVFASALLCGLLPAFKAVKRDMNHALKQEERQTSRTWNLRSVLVAGQLAISIVLLAAGFLFVHNLLRATSMNPGFDVHHTIWAYMRLVPEQYKDPDQTKQLSVTHAALERLRALPGVEAAAITRHVPLNDNCVMGVHLQTDISSTLIPARYQCNNVGPDYFRTIGIPILRGREFSPADRKGAQPVVIVNETFARAVFGGVDPVGHTIKTNLPDDKTNLPNGKAKLIVGVAKDSRYFALGENQQLAVYEPYFAYDEPINLHFLLRTSGSPAGYVKAINDALGRLDSDSGNRNETNEPRAGTGFAAKPGRGGDAGRDGNTRTNSGGYRTLWSAAVLGFTPYPGDWFENGARGAASGCVADRRRPQLVAGGLRRGCRSGSGLFCYAATRAVPCSRSEHCRLDRFPGSDRRARRSCAARYRGACQPGATRGSDDGVEIRVSRAFLGLKDHWRGDRQSA